MCYLLTHATFISETLANVEDELPGSRTEQGDQLKGMGQEAVAPTRCPEFTGLLLSLNSNEGLGCPGGYQGILPECEAFLTLRAACILMLRSTTIPEALIP